MSNATSIRFGNRFHFEVIEFVLVGLLAVPFVALLGLAALDVLPWQPSTYGRYALALLFAFTGLGHFVQTQGMEKMIPPRVPARRAIVLASGVLEWALSGSLLVPRWVPWSGLAIVVFLVAVFPLNVYAAVRRVPYGGHEAGMKYLVPRAGLQLLFIAWAYAAAVA
jgi:uncharacterized membrane protein